MYSNKYSIVINNVGIIAKDLTHLSMTGFPTDPEADRGSLVALGGEGRSTDKKASSSLFLYSNILAQTLHKR